MSDVLQALIGVVIVAGFWWVVLAVIRAIAPPRRKPAPDQSGLGSVAYRPRPSPTGGVSRPAASLGGQQGWTAPRARRGSATPCCPDCTPGCQVTGLAMGQAWGRGDDWWGQPFGDDGANVEAMVFWGDDCCVDCATCPICQSL